MLVGINLLREGLDLPEVQLVAILDADKTGFLRSASSLIQTMGRAARNVDGLVVLYADTITDAMRAAISETQRRRALQQAYNAEHGIDPTTIRKAVTDILAASGPAAAARGRGGAGAPEADRARPGTPVRAGRGLAARRRRGPAPERRGRARRRERRTTPTAVDEMARAPSPAGRRAPAAWSSGLEPEMRQAASELRYEEAALLRDEIAELRLALVAEADGRTGAEPGPPA